VGGLTFVDYKVNRERKKKNSLIVKKHWPECTNPRDLFCDGDGHAIIFAFTLSKSNIE
jgi:hypothetical protein